MAQWSYLRKAVCLANEAFRFLHVFKFKKYSLTSFVPIELFKATARDSGTSVSAITSENRGSPDHRPLPELESQGSVYNHIWEAHFHSYYQEVLLWDTNHWSQVTKKKCVSFANDSCPCPHSHYSLSRIIPSRQTPGSSWLKRNSDYESGFQHVQVTHLNRQVLRHHFPTPIKTFLSHSLRFPVGPFPFCSSPSSFSISFFSFLSSTSVKLICLFMHSHVLERLPKRVCKTQQDYISVKWVNGRRKIKGYENIKPGNKTRKDLCEPSQTLVLHASMIQSHFRVVYATSSDWPFPTTVPLFNTIAIDTI